MIQDFKLVERVIETPSVCTLRLVPKGTEEYSYRAGTFALVSIPGSDIPARAFSFSSAPSDPFVELTIERTGKMTTALHELPLGSLLRLNGPRGRFTLPDELSGPVLMVAGGSGIAPLRSMLRSLKRHSRLPPITLLYSVQSPSEIIFRSELEQISENMEGLTYVPTVTRPSTEVDWLGRVGRIDKQTLATQLPVHKSLEVFVCGSPAFVFAMIQYLRELGIERERIRTEQWLQPELE